MGYHAKHTILAVTNTYCDLKTEQYIFLLDEYMNEELLEDDHIRKTHIYVYLVDIALHYGKYENKNVALAYFKYFSDDSQNWELGHWDCPIYNEEVSEEIISQTEILEWNLIGESGGAKQEYYKEYLELYGEVDANYLMRNPYFITRVYFHKLEWLNGLEEGMSIESVYDTLITDWM